MDLTLDATPAGNVVRAWTPQGAHVGDQFYAAGLIVNTQRLEAPWPMSVAALDATVAGNLLGWQPELIILGTGDKLTFPAAAFSARIMTAGVGFEAMTSGAACRTYNVLVGENRAVLLALLPL